MGDTLKINTESVRQLATDIKNETETLVKMISIANDKVQSTAMNYQSEAAKGFRTKMETFSKNAAEGSKENLGNLAEYFEEIAKLYENTDDTIAQAEKEFLQEDLFA